MDSLPTSLPPGVFSPQRYRTAISYGRYSSGPQAKGESRDRQEKALRETLTRFGWTLLDSFFDPGISGGRGKNRAVGALARLLKRVRSKEIPTPVVLVVEALDRLSREEASVAQELFLSLINAGVAIYTTIDGQGFDKQTININVGGLFTSLGTMIGAHMVWKGMASRAEARWIKRRRELTAMCPGWLRLKADRSDYDVVDGAKELVDRIFEEAQYMGLDRLAMRLTEEGTKPFETWNHKAKNSRQIWYDKHLRRIITGRAVRGEVEVGKYVWEKATMEVDGETIEYERAVRHATGTRVKIYPEMVSEELWQRANDALKARATGRGRKGAGFANLFQGLARCWDCGGPMNLKSSPKRSGGVYQYYRCDTYHRRSQAKCSNDYVYNYSELERHMLEAFAHQILKPDQRQTTAVTRLHKQIAELRAEVDSLSEKRAYAKKAFDKAADQRKGSKTARHDDVAQAGILLEYENERRGKQAEIEALEKQLAKELAATPATKTFEQVKQTIMTMERLPEKERYALRAKINSGLKHIIAKITFGYEGEVVVWFPKREDGTWPVWDLAYRRGKWLWNAHEIMQQDVPHLADVSLAICPQWIERDG